MLNTPYSEDSKLSGPTLMGRIVLALFFCSVELSVATESSAGGKGDVGKMSGEAIYRQLQDEIGTPLQLNPTSSEQAFPVFAKGDSDVEPGDMILETLITAFEKKVSEDIYESLKTPGSGPN